MKQNKSILTTVLAFAVSSFFVNATPVISEFMAANDATLADEDGDFSDWIEIHNPDGSEVDLDGYFLTDKAGNLDKWRIPAVTIPAGGYLVIFASDKDRSDPEGELHANFKLPAEGGYLALVAPNGANVLTDFGSSYPLQFEDQSYGRDSFGSVTVTQLIDGSLAAKYLVPADDSLGDTWQALPDSFDDSSWISTTTGIGFDNGVLLDLVGDTNHGNSTLKSQMQSVNASCYIRIPFTYDSESNQIQSLSLRVNCDDGFVAYINGVEAGSFNSPGDLAWDSNATASRSDSIAASTPIVVDATAGATQVVDGVNILAIQGLNRSASSSDFLIYPELTADVADTSGAQRDGFFDSPSPGLPNSSGQAAGPLFANITDKPVRPTAGQDLVVTATMEAVASPVSSVTLFYRVMFGSESTLVMNDEGTGSDALANDGIFTAAIPGTAFDAGEMIRWRFEASDELGLGSKIPTFKDPVDSHEYVGTVAIDPSINTKLSVVEWFVQSPGAATGTGGTRGAIFYLGELYDNVFFNRHGQSTGGFPKKSYNIDFNKSQRFRWSEDAPRTKDIDLLTNWADKSKVRHVLAYEIMRNAGVHAHFAYTVRVQQNGEFFSTADFVEDADNIYLKRAGLNEDGALYKAYNNTLTGSANTGFEKKNRQHENNDDLQDLINGLALNGTAYDDFTFDNVNIPMCVNMMAAAAVIRNTDMHRKNWYIYRDSGKSDEWALLPWDLDLSQARYWRSQFNYFSNLLETTGFIETGGASRLVSQLYSRPSTRAMFYRRVRTLHDLYLQPADTPMAERYYERRLNELSALIDPDDIVPSDAQLDFEKWGSWLHNADGGGAPVVPYTNPSPDVESMSEGVQRLRDEFLAPRRTYIYSQNSIPDPQTGQLSIVYAPLLSAGAPVSHFVPGDGSIDNIWMDFDFNDSGWTNGTTGVGFDSSAKYIPLIGSNTEDTMRGTHSSVYMRCEFEVADPSVFQALELRMKYDDGFIVYLNGEKIAEEKAPASPAWNSIATAAYEANPLEYDIWNVSASLGELRTGTNVLAIHGMNRSLGSADLVFMPELHGGIADSNGSLEPLIEFGTIEFNPASSNQDEEYIELVNNNGIAVDISNWKVKGGVEFEIPAGTVIPAGWTLFLSPDAKAFRSRLASPTGGEGNFVVSPYSGHLSSLGESLTLLDQFGMENNSTSYLGDPSDQQEHLVISEIMYHPEPDGLAEYIELMNVSDSVTLDLTGVKFTNGIEFDFTGSSVTSLAPGGRVLVVRDLAAFELANGAGLPVAGVFANSTGLSNGGEGLKLEDASNGT
ncbi:lamin tail domain-containing protein, partial [bacterium]|nr:lamin tail domain-containing protein [bacterium]